MSARGGLPQSPDEAGGGAGAGEPRRGPWYARPRSQGGRPRRRERPPEESLPREADPRGGIHPAGRGDAGAPGGWRPRSVGLGARAQTLGGGPRSLPVSGSLRTLTRRPEVELSSASSQGCPQTPAVPARALRLPTRGRPTPPRKCADAEQPTPLPPPCWRRGPGWGAPARATCLVPGHRAWPAGLGRRERRLGAASIALEPAVPGASKVRFWGQHPSCPFTLSLMELVEFPELYGVVPTTLKTALSLNEKGGGGHR